MAKSMDKQIIKELGVHGKKWQTFHGGYFSDPAVASPFVEVVQKAIRLSRPGVIVDLGGGTGFLLNELIKHNVAPKIRLVNLDISQRQLDVKHSSRIYPIHQPMNEFRRADAHKGNNRFLFMMRSALHYFGRDGLMPLLHHLRSQFKKGEFFVHQTACFDCSGDARCLNRLYQCIGTKKWYPTIKQLCMRMEKAGWNIVSIVPAPSLLLTSRDLGKRYSLDKNRLSEIRDELLKYFGEKDDVFRLTQKDFCAFLHYQIFTCVAI